MFFGIIIRMYYAPIEHSPAHIHAYFQEQRASIGIIDGEIINGTLPSRQLKLVLACIEILQNEIVANWVLCQNSEKPFKIEPLR